MKESVIDEKLNRKNDFESIRPEAGLIDDDYNSIITNIIKENKQECIEAKLEFDEQFMCLRIYENNEFKDIYKSINQQDFEKFASDNFDLLNGEKNSKWLIGG